MRLDAYLRRVGLIKQRSLAKQICDKGLVRVDGREAKASKEITLGLTIELDMEREFLEIEVIGLPDRNYRRKDGSGFYSIKTHEQKSFPL